MQSISKWQVINVIKINACFCHTWKRRLSSIEITRRFIKLFTGGGGTFVSCTFVAKIIFFTLTIVWSKTVRSNLYLSPSTSVDRLQQPRGTLSCGRETQRWVRGGHLITRIDRIEWIVVAVAACSAFRMTASITGRYHATCSFSPFPASLSLLALHLSLFLSSSLSALCITLSFSSEVLKLLRARTCWKFCTK